MVVDSRSVMARLEEADKMLRKGDMAQARALYAALLPEAPPEMAHALRTRIQRVDELAAPGEQNVKASAQDSSAQGRAEAAVNEGRLDEAIETYAGIVSTRPDDQLARERLAELMTTRTQQSTDRSRAPIRTVAAQESGPVGQALPPPSPRLAPTAQQAPLPSDPVEMLKEMLLRVNKNRRAPSVFNPPQS